MSIHSRTEVVWRNQDAIKARVAKLEKATKRIAELEKGMRVMRRQLGIAVQVKRK